MNDISILIGGKAGFGIDRSGMVIADILNKLGYRLYVYRDYPSIIRGGHTFSIVRASDKKIAAHKDKVDVLLALNQDTVDLHKGRLADQTVIVYDSDSVKPETLPAGIQAIGIAMAGIIKETGAPEIMRNTCMIGAFCKVSGIDWPVPEDVLKKNFPKEAEPNLKLARRGYDEAGRALIKIETIKQNSLPVLTGNEALSRGLVKGGLQAYIAYPMTPSSPILHSIAAMAREFGLSVVHPENEISVMLMALGFSYCGRKVAVGTSGGGFCLMTEGLSFSGMAELPVVVILGQRPGPSTGLPTYSSQTELHFALNAGQGEFPRFLAAPADAEEGYYWSQVALNMSWKYQVPSIILSDKNMGEGAYSFDEASIKKVDEAKPSLWDRQGQYKRYSYTENGVSRLAFVPDKDAVIKVNSYEHDESGITTEDPAQAISMQDKRLRKEKYMAQELEGYETVKVHGNKSSPVSLLCWGSAAGVCVEAAENLGLKVIQVLVLSPFPLKRFKAALKGVKKLIAVENSATGQLVKLINGYGLDADAGILKYDGRPFGLEELREKLKAVAG